MIWQIHQMDKKMIKILLKLKYSWEKYKYIVFIKIQNFKNQFQRQWLKYSNHLYLVN